MDSSTLAALGGALVVIVLIGLAIAILLIISMWKIFTKAGEPGWKAIIPYYNTYTMFKFSWKVNMFWVYLAVSIASSVFGRSQGFLGIIGMICSLALIVLSIMSMYYLAKSFGKGAGFTVGLVLLSVVFVPILAFGSAQYIGNTTE